MPLADTLAPDHGCHGPNRATEAAFRVMGTDAHVVVVDGPPDAASRARARLDELEARWSRFRPDSELCRLNERAGHPVIVSPSTFALVDRACEWWAATGGAFDPTVLSALEEAGYDRSYEQVADRDDLPAGAAPSPTPGCARIALDPVVGSITLPPDVRIDLGGIAKGFAADLVAEEILGSGAGGVCVNLGGDLRVAGRPPGGADAWVVALDTTAARDDAHPLLALADGAIATSSRVLRTWRRGDATHHHIIDPRTGRSAHTPWTSATVLAGRATDAEPLAKAVLLAPTTADAAQVLAAHGATGVLVDDAGELHRLPGADAYLIADRDGISPDFARRGNGLGNPDRRFDPSERPSPHR